MAAERPVRVVLDTNVVLSALVFQRGALGRLRHLWQGGAILPLVSSETTKELLRVLAYPKFHLGREEQQELLADYLPFAEAVKVERMSNALAHVPACRDPADQMFLDLAQAGGAELLVTGDRDLLDLNDRSQRHMRFAVVTPSQALSRWPA